MLEGVLFQPNAGIPTCAQLKTTAAFVHALEVQPWNQFDGG